MTITADQKKELKTLVTIVEIGIDFLCLQMGEVDEQYEYGIRHCISEQVASFVSKMFSKDSIDTDTCGRHLKLYGVDDTLTKPITEEEIESRILEYVNSEYFKTY